MAEFKHQLRAVLPWVLLAVAALFIVGGALILRQPSGNVSEASTTIKKRKVKGGRFAPDFDVKTLDGERLRLVDLRGKVVVLDFWSITCGPCIEANKHLQQMYGKYRKMDFEIVGISVDPSPGMVRQFLETHPLDYPIALATDKVIRDYGGIYSLPQTYLIDRDGKIARKYEGYSALAAHQMETTVQKLLSED